LVRQTSTLTFKIEPFIVGISLCDFVRKDERFHTVMANVRDSCTNTASVCWPTTLLGSKQMAWPLETALILRTRRDDLGDSTPDKKMTALSGQ
jgi:hypothetical protein